MNDRTRRYLGERFGEYYRSADLATPPNPGDREWGHIPFTAGGTTMVRHQALLDLGGGVSGLQEFLTREAPRHVYFSAATYDDPGNSEMDAKGWRGTDLVFDLDADHLPGIDAEAATYPEMLDACKDALRRLLDLLERDFGFTEDDLSIVFSGGRGYHVHVRTDRVRDLDSAARREIVDYVRAIDLDRDDLVHTVQHGGTTRRELKTGGGWGARVHDALVAFVDDLREMDEDDALERLMELDGIGEGRATTILGAVRRNPDAVREGNVEVGGPGLRKLVGALAQRVTATQTAPIDEPVTTDVRRLIRLPGSLHGGSGLVVTPIDRGDLDDFDPLVDAVPEPFREGRTMVDVTEPGPVPVGPDAASDGPAGTTKVDEGVQSVLEYVGVFLMARGRAEAAEG